jgi:hypothetical protein
MVVFLEGLYLKDKPTICSIYIAVGNVSVVCNIDIRT